LPINIIKNALSEKRKILATLPFATSFKGTFKTGKSAENWHSFMDIIKRHKSVTKKIGRAISATLPTFFSDFAPAYILKKKKGKKTRMEGIVS
jgi:hypothetical protein